MRKLLMLVLPRPDIADRVKKTPAFSKASKPNYVTQIQCPPIVILTPKRQIFSHFIGGIKT